MAFSVPCDRWIQAKAGSKTSARGQTRFRHASGFRPRPGRFPPAKAPGTRQGACNSKRSQEARASRSGFREGEADRESGPQDIRKVRASDEGAVRQVKSPIAFASIPPSVVGDVNELDRGVFRPQRSLGRLSRSHRRPIESEGELDPRIGGL